MKHHETILIENQEISANIRVSLNLKPPDVTADGGEMHACYNPHYGWKASLGLSSFFYPKGIVQYLCFF
jgi:hypothetical protein